MNLMLSSENFMKVVKGAALAAFGAAAAYIAQNFEGVHPAWGPAIAGFAAVVANYVRKLIEERLAS